MSSKAKFARFSRNKKLVARLLWLLGFREKRLLYLAGPSDMAFVDVVLAVLSVKSRFSVLNGALAPVVIISFTGYTFCSVLTLVFNTIVELLASLALKYFLEIRSRVPLHIRSIHINHIHTDARQISWYNTTLLRVQRGAFL